MNRARGLILLGSTGSIGRSTLEVVDFHPGRFRVDALAANRSIPLLLQQAKKYRPRLIAAADPEAAGHLRSRVRGWKRPPQILAGQDGICRAARLPGAQLVVSAMVGTAGLLPTLEAIAAGKDIALANKETLVMAGEVVMAAARAAGVRVLPVDSEHAALAQCLKGQAPCAVRRLVLTASGGPFRLTPAGRLRRVTIRDALRHPTWSMGRKITVDSSTLMNKGLEVIEAHHLFGLPYERIDVVVHPQSVVHSMVEFVDGSVLAQLATPDMRLPIQTALTAPEQLASAVRPLDFTRAWELTFMPPDGKRFPCLGLAYAAGRAGKTAPAVLNAANEIAVQAFMQGRLDFPGIPRLIQRVLERRSEPKRADLQSILAQDTWARQAAEEEMACKRSK